MEEHRENAYCTTHWSIVLAASSDESQVAGDALADLFLAYRKPLYAYVRRIGNSHHDAEDLIQSFFEHLQSKGGLARADPDKGRFRSFLLGSLKMHIRNTWRKGQAEKRGGGATIISIDQDFGEQCRRIDPSHELTPDQLYDKACALSLLERARQCLRDDYHAAGKDVTFAALEPFLTGDASETSYAQKAEELGRSVSAVTAAIHRLKKQFGKRALGLVAETVERPEDVQAELDYLLAAALGS